MPDGAESFGRKKPTINNKVSVEGWLKDGRLDLYTMREHGGGALSSGEVPQMWGGERVLEKNRNEVR